MSLFVTSDTHFGHANILEYCKRPFESVEHMNRELIARWNDRVTDNDDIVVLGDFAMGKISETLPIAERLNGNKFLVPGNHDRCFSESKNSEKWVKKYEEVGFKVLPERWVFGLQGTYFVEVCHFPFVSNAYDSRYRHKHPEDVGNKLLSGHVHDAWKVQGHNINVGTDVWGYAPVHEDELVELFEKENNE